MFPCMQRAGNSKFSLGEAILRERSLFPESYWYWIGVGAMIGYAVLFNILFTFFLGYLNRESSHSVNSLLNVNLFFCFCL